MTDAVRVEFGAALLCGGASRRFGRDKALVEVDGRPLASRVASALSAAGADPVVVIGGDPRIAHVSGHRHVADRWPTEGPLGGIITALAEPWDTPIVFIAACDLPDLDALDVVNLVASHDMAQADVTIGVDPDGRDQWLLGAWSPVAIGALHEQFDRGVRAPKVAVATGGLDVRRYSVSARSAFDIDYEHDLAIRDGRGGR